MIKSKYKHEVRVLQSDNGGENINHDMDRFCKDNSIRHQTSCAGSIPTTPNLEPRVFGCTCYVHQNTGKLEPWAVKCVFMGYADCKKGYRCYNPRERKMYITRDIVFHENTSFFSHECSLQGERTPYHEENTHDTHEYYEEFQINLEDPISNSETVDAEENIEPSINQSSNETHEAQMKLTKPTVQPLLLLLLLLLLIKTRL